MKKISILFILMLFSSTVFADFSIYQGSEKDYGCDVAYNSTENEYLVVWLESYSTQMKRLRASRVSENGQPGAEFTISDYAQGLPSVAYNSQQNEYLVVFVTGIAPDLSIYGQRVSTDGVNIGGTILLIPNAENPTVLYNSISGNYLVIGEEKLPDNLQAGYSYTRYYSRKIGVDGQPLAAAKLFYNSYPTSLVDTDVISYKIAYAPVKTTETPNGRYLLAYHSPASLMMLDSDGNAMVTLTNPQSGVTYPSVPFQQSKIGISEGWDVAFGYWNGQPVFLVVWADRDNKMTWQGMQWTGIWGGVVDATKIDYLTTDGVSNETFPISKIWSHWAYSTYAETWNPVVEYSAVAGKFMVAWRETPGPDSQNDTQVNHIRANSIGSEDITSTITDNIILSATTGTENPYQPALVISSTSPNALVVWEDNRNFGTNDLDVYGNLLKATATNNTPVGTNVKVNLTNDVSMTFNNVTSSGNTSLVTTSGGTPPPGGFQIVPSGLPIYYNIETTATFTGSIEICIHYNDTGMTAAQEAALRLQVYENPPGQWKDITTLLNTTTNIICCSVNHLSEFGIMTTSGTPNIEVTPSSITVSVDGGNSTTEELIIKNTGDVDFYFNLSGEKWEKMPGAATDISVGADGAVWMLGTNPNENGYDIYRWNGADWDAIAGGATSIDVGSENQVIVVNKGNEIYKWDGIGFQLLPGKVRQASIASDGTMMAISTNKIFGGYEILKWNGSDWDVLTGGAVKISIGSQNHIWCLSEFALVYHWHGSEWDLFPGLASDIGVGADGSAWAVGIFATPGGFETFKWDGANWIKQPGSSVALSVGSAENIWRINDTGEIFNWNSSGADLPGWLTANPSTGAVSAVSQQSVTLTLDALQLTPSEYNFDLFISSSDPDESVVVVPVKLNVLQAVNPVLSVNPVNLDFSTSKTNLSFQIQNTGSGTLNWEAVENPAVAWMSISPANGSGNSSVEVVVDRTNLAPGNFSGKVKIVSNGGEQEVTVSMIVPSQGQPIIRFNPATSQMQVGTPAAVDIVLENITDLGSFEFEIEYDAAIVQVAQASDVTQGAFFSSTGRNAIPVGPNIDNANGALVFGAASLGSQPGASGTGVLATILWTPKADGTTPLDLKNVKIADTKGTSITVIEEDGEIQVGNRFWADVDNDKDVDIIDVQLVAAHWNTKQGDSNFDPVFDVDNEGAGDGDVDIIDVQLVASWWNKPIPPNNSVFENPAPAKATSANPVSLKITVNESGANGKCPSLDVFVENARDLGAFQFDVILKSENIRLSEIQTGEFLAANGNKIGSLGPVKSEKSNRYTAGAFSYGNQTGSNGAGLLATINIEGEFENSIPVEFSNFILTDSKGKNMEVGTINAEYQTWCKSLPIPENFMLHQNYPNPFNPTTFIRYDLPALTESKQNVTLRIYNLQGQLVQILVEDEKAAGTYRVQWNGTNSEGERVPSGIYIYTLQAGKFKTSRKMLFLK